MPTERNHQIRERAFYLWEADGSPKGREMDYWLRAEQDLDAGVPEPERISKATVKASSARATKAGSSSKKAAKPKASSKRTSTK